jgi:outer membrane phospholipase A
VFSEKRTLLLRWMGLSALFFFLGTAHAGISYSLNAHQAQPGDTVVVTGILFNDTPSALNWTPPSQLAVQWHNAAGQTSSTTATLKTVPQNIALPVNNFTRIEWQLTVPAQARGAQALEIDGQTGRLALTVPSDSKPFASDQGSDHAAGPPAGEAKVSSGGPGASAMAPGGLAAPVGINTGSNDLFQRFSNAISPHEPIYFDFGNRGGRNARFQISLKYRLFTPNDPANPDFIDSLYLGYTQTSLWDLSSDSLPFVDTSFKPSLFWRRDALWSSQDQNVFLGLASGVEHESNGKSGDESRSLNFAYIQPEFNYRFGHGSTLTFAPKVKSYFGTSNNPDYTDYAGYVDWKLRWAQDNGLILSGMYRHGRSGHNTTQLEAAWPLKRTFLNMNGYLHVQYFRGYGETLLGYNRKAEPQVRVGLSLIP